jgi:hypothetical protein
MGLLIGQTLLGENKNGLGDRSTRSLKEDHDGHKIVKAIP